MRRGNRVWERVGQQLINGPINYDVSVIRGDFRAALGSVNWYWEAWKVILSRRITWGSLKAKTRARVFILISLPQGRLKEG